MSQEERKREYTYSIFAPKIKEIGIELVNRNADVLLRYIYDHSSEAPFDNPEVRVGLANVILMKTRDKMDEDLVQMILKDIESLRNDASYLSKFDRPNKRLCGLQEEYLHIQNFIDWEEKITLNTQNEEEKDDFSQKDEEGLDLCLVM